MPKFVVPVKIVHICADAAERQRVHDVLTSLPYPVFEVFSVADVRCLVENRCPAPFKPDVLLLDIQFSAVPLDAFDLFRGVMANLEAVPIIMLSSGLHDIDTVYDLIRAGVDNVYMKKTHNDPTLQLFVMKALARAHRYQDTETKITETWRLLSELRHALEAHAVESAAQSARLVASPQLDSTVTVMSPAADATES